MAGPKNQSIHKKTIREEDLVGFKYFKKFKPLLDHLHDSYRHHNRKFHYDQYISLMLFYFFNPILTSLRGLEAATGLKKLEQNLVAVDGTLLPALPKMLWALWLDDDRRAAKMHLSFSVIKHVPLAAKVTDANASERSVFREFLAPDNLYVLDAGYVEYRLLNEIEEAGSSFVARLRDNATWDDISERPLTTEGKVAGVKRDVVVQLGSASKRKDYPKPVRVIEIEYYNDSPPGRSRVSSKKTFGTSEIKHNMLLVTNRLDLPAEVIALIYKYRWQVELFFRWFKRILSCQHMLAISQNGLTLQVYSALIASLLISLWTGKKPTKRTFEMICMYFAGWAEEDELFEHIEKLNHN